MRRLLGVVVALALLGIGASVLDRGHDRAVSAVDDGALPAPVDGWRWATWRDAAVQVPEAWADGYEPGPDWCANDNHEPDARPASYVAREPADDAHFDIGCHTGAHPWPTVFGAAPEGFWTPHLSFDDPARGAPVGSTTYDGWSSTVVGVGDARVRVLGDGASAEVVDRILATARTIAIDPAGCATTSPAQAALGPPPARPAPVDLAELSGPVSAVVCQYDPRPTDRPGLRASRRLAPETAAAVLAAFRSAPAGGGPDTPTTCRPDEGGAALVVRFRTAEQADWRDVWVFHESCRHHGVDDGVTFRALTTAGCAPLFDDRFRPQGGSEAVFRLCGLI